MICEKCVHLPICAYFAKNFEEFSLPCESQPCYRFEGQMELIECANTDQTLSRENSPFYNTVEGMLSPDYKERFKAEYRQTKIRYDKLHAMLVKADAGKLEFKPTCPLDLLRNQAQTMEQYLYCLEVRAQIEDVNVID